MRTPTLAAMLLAAFVLPATASDTQDYLLETAGNLANLCGEPGNPTAIHMCEGYLVGVHQMHAAIADSIGVKVYCIPENAGITRNSVAADFSAWVKAHPDMASLSAREGLLTWAHQTYPCK